MAKLTCARRAVGDSIEPVGDTICCVSYSQPQRNVRTLKRNGIKERLSYAESLFGTAISSSRFSDIETNWIR